MFSEFHFYSSRLLHLTYIQLHQSVIRLISLGPYQQFPEYCMTYVLKIYSLSGTDFWEANRVSAGQEFLLFL